MVGTAPMFGTAPVDRQAGMVQSNRLITSAIFRRMAENRGGR